MARPKEFDREIVLKKAMHLFWRKGYEATSIQDLVEQTGINRGSLYDTYGGKQQLYYEALDCYGQNEGMAMFTCVDETVSPLARLRQVFTNLIDQALTGEGRFGCFAVNASMELAARNTVMAERAEQLIDVAEKRFLTLLEQAQAAGELAADRDLKALARFLVSGMMGLRTIAKMKPDRTLLTDVVETTLSVL